MANTEKKLNIPKPEKTNVYGTAKEKCRCGHWLFSDFKYCPKCGEKIVRG